MGVTLAVKYCVDTFPAIVWIQVKETKENSTISSLKENGIL